MRQRRRVVVLGGGGQGEAEGGALVGLAARPRRCRRGARRCGCTLARPMPVPSKSSVRCRRWNTPNSLPTYFMSKPTPLSRDLQAVAVRRCAPALMRDARRVAAARVLDRVGQQVAQRHLQQQRVGPQRAAAGLRSSHSMRRPCSWRLQLVAPGRPPAPCVSTAAALERRAAHAREVEQRVHQLAGVGRRVLDVAQVALRALGQLRAVRAPAPGRRSRRCGASARAGRARRCSRRLPAPC